jgi:excisionase family DNA binding protein
MPGAQAVSGRLIGIEAEELLGMIEQGTGRALAPLAKMLSDLAKAARAAEPKPDPTKDGTLTAKDVAAALGVDRRELRRLVAAGEFPAPMKVGRRRIRWPRSDLMAYLARPRGAQ